MKRPAVVLWREAIVASKLPTNARLVALVLSVHMDGAGGSCWPTLELLADETGLSVRAVQRQTARLRADGWLSTTYVRRPQAPGVRAHYRAIVPAWDYDPPD